MRPSTLPILILLPFLVTIFSLDIYILAFNRTDSLLQCLASLRNAVYPPNPNIRLTVQVDRRPDGTINETLIRALNESPQWPHGPEIRIKVQANHVGLQQQWLSVKARNYTLIMEDDVIISPAYFCILQAAIRRDSNALLGVTLQRPQWQQGQNEHGRWRRLNLISPSHPAAFTFMGPATWGVLVYPKQWNRFLRWARLFMANPKRQYTSGAITTKWMNERGKDKLITPLMFEFMKTHDLAFINFWIGNDTALAVSRSLETNSWLTRYYQDELLGVSRKIVEIVNMLQSDQPLPRYSGCLDRIRENRKRHPSLETDRINKFLRDACRMTDYFEAPNITWAQVQTRLKEFCPTLGSMDYLPNRATMQCPYKKGMYPDYSDSTGLS